MVLALVHLAFPRYFGWRQELAPLSLVNRQIMQVHTFFIGLVILLMGVLCVTSATELTGTVLGRKLLLGLGIFWACRLGIQFFWFSPRLWRGKAFETTVHLVFTLLWIYLSTIFLIGSGN